MSRKTRVVEVTAPDAEYREIAEKNQQLAERVAVQEKPVCPHCGHQEFRKAGRTKAKYSNQRQRWKCSNCKRSMVEDDRRYGNIMTESMLWEQAALAAINDPSGKTFRAVARKAEEIGDEYFWNWKNSTVRRFFMGVSNGH